MYHTSLRTKFSANKTTTPRIAVVMTTLMGRREGKAGFFPAVLLSVVMCVVAYATAILSCCCLVNLSYAILGRVVFILIV